MRELIKLELVNPAFFVTGTGTDVGKTFFSSLFMAKYGISHDYRYWKPIQTGSSGSRDRDLVQTASLLPEERFLPSLYEFEHPSSPHFASAKEGRKIEIASLTQKILVQVKEAVLLEGAGGIFVPITEEVLFWDLIRRINVPVVLVNSSQLGTINHTLLSLEALLQRFIPVVGFYTVGTKNELLEDNIRIIQKFGGVPNLGFTEYPKEYLMGKHFVEYANTHFDPNYELIHSLLSMGDVSETF
ncbi:ATP-dependent dethiobiotin synthetase BioD [Leptospira ryugenii]|uniref:ATP-dependent dethiobiotin synthetase BioD n=1 Tax=Leptospira ryugenii TaxID=1917863 RepID=A0A2P2DZV5_9LEPT|nr:dethiobiotin synthase [Leptospira ryugenii]GBF50157.1 ATP-dependent dethiobiotin synthetase BioD [Leptospira ryugenii]